MSHTMSEMADALFGDSSAPANQPADTKPAAPPARTLDDMAAAMYGEEQPTQKPVQKPPQKKIEFHEARTKEEMAEEVYGERNAPPEAVNRIEASIPEEVRKLREADTARNFYGPPTPSDQLVSSLDEVAKLVDDTDTAAPEVRKAEATEWLNVGRDMGFEASDVQQVVNIAKTALPGLDQAKVQEWRDETDRQLAEKYGDEADKMLQHAQALVARDPRLDQFLGRTRLGNHPVIVMRIVEKARELTASGKFRPPIYWGK